MITGIDELETLGKYIACECKCKFDCRKRNSNQKENNAKRQCERTSCVQKRLYLEFWYMQLQKW